MGAVFAMVCVLLGWGSWCDEAKVDDLDDMRLAIGFERCLRGLERLEGQGRISDLGGFVVAIHSDVCDLFHAEAVRGEAGIW